MPVDEAIDLVLSPALDSLDDLRRSQIPFAKTVALNSTAFETRKFLQGDFGSRFEERSTYVPRGIKVQKGTKRRPEAVVFWAPPGKSPRPLRAAQISRQEFGGRRPSKSRLQPIPTKHLPRGKGGTIPKRWRMGAVKNQPRVFLARTNTPGTFGIYQRQGPGSRPFRMLYFLSHAPMIAPRWEFRARGSAFARRAFDREFGRAFARAIRTARPR